MMRPATSRSILFIGGVAALLYILHRMYAPDGYWLVLEGYYDAALEKAETLLSQGKRGIDWVLASEYGDRVRLFLYAYLVFAVAALLFPGYPKTFGAFSQMVEKDDLKMAGILGVLGGLCILCWFIVLRIEESENPFPTWPFPNGRLDNGLLLLLLLFPGLVGVLVMIGIALSSVVWIPVLLLVLPGIMAALSSFLFTIVILAPMKGLIAIWHYLHYLFVSHPAETVYRQGMEKHGYCCKNLY